MVRFALDAITGFSTVPLRLASYAGVAMSVFSMVMLAYTLGSWTLGRAVAGWTSLTTIVLIIGSTQLLVLGVLGEYLGRLYMESKRRPLFVVESICAASLAADIRESTAAPSLPAARRTAPAPSHVDARPDLPQPLSMQANTG